MGSGLRYFGRTYHVSSADHAAEVTRWTTHLIELARPCCDDRGVLWEPAVELPAVRIDALDPSGGVTVFLRMPFRRAGKGPAPVRRKPHHPDNDSDE